MEAVAKLRNNPTSTRKMRKVADMIRGKRAEEARQILHFSKQEASIKLEKLLMSALSNWEQTNEELSLEDADLFVKEIRVDGGRILKRIQPAPQGRAHRINKRSNHVTLVIDNLNADLDNEDFEGITDEEE